MTVNVIVRRFDPALRSNAYTDTFQVAVSADDQWTALDLLDYIQQNLDSSLRYHRHSVCNRGICMRCLVKINSKVRRLCEFVVASEGDILLEPVSEKAVVIDLVTR